MRQVTAENVHRGMVIRHHDGSYLSVMTNTKQTNGRHRLHCLNQTAKEVWLNDVNPTLYYDLPVVPGDNVKLLKEGVHRVLNGEPGQPFLVDKVTNGLMGPVAHVRDYRFPDTASHKKFAIWSISFDGYEVEGG